MSDVILAQVKRYSSSSKKRESLRGLDLSKDGAARSPRAGIGVVIVVDNKLVVGRLGVNESEVDVGRGLKSSEVLGGEKSSGLNIGDGDGVRNERSRERSTS